MNDIYNLSIKNECFGEIDYGSLTQEMKDKALLLFMLMVMNRSDEIKSRGVSNGSY